MAEHEDCNVADCPRHDLAAKRRCTLRCDPRRCEHHCFKNGVKPRRGEAAYGG